jgi:hypothetical protein
MMKKSVPKKTNDVQAKVTFDPRRWFPHSLEREVAEFNMLETLLEPKNGFLPNSHGYVRR